MYLNIVRCTIEYIVIPCMWDTLLEFPTVLVFLARLPKLLDQGSPMYISTPIYDVMYIYSYLKNNVCMCKYIHRIIYTNKYMYIQIYIYISYHIILALQSLRENSPEALAAHARALSAAAPGCLAHAVHGAAPLKCRDSDMGGSIHGGTPKWIVYKENTMRMMIWGGN